MLEAVKVKRQGNPIRASRFHTDAGINGMTILKPRLQLLEAPWRVRKNPFRFATIAQRNAWKVSFDRSIPKNDAIGTQPPIMASFLDRPCAFELTGDAVLTIPSDLCRRLGQAAYLSREAKTPRS
ncbi:MAG TPA: hypothetical protein VIX83_13305 [Candidatus Cybelea sp.]